MTCNSCRYVPCLIVCPFTDSWQPNISFAQSLDKSILQTLSTHDASANGQINGFLYVPDLLHNDPCANLSKLYVPSNVTRQANLPPTDFTLIAVAPWINAQCTQSYLAAARMDPCRAILFFQPSNDTTQDVTAQPPPISSSVWNLNDGGAWKSSNPFPAYAVSSFVGSQLLYQLSLYSGNMTNVPYGHEISELPGIDPRDYVRLYTQIDVSSTSSLPSLWVFVLIIVALLAVLLGTTSTIMHLLQRYRRNDLRRRVVNGQVNLESLGIKRLTVPQEVIDIFPIFTYNCEEEGEKSPHNSTGPRDSLYAPKRDRATAVNVHDSTEGSNSKETEGTVSNHRPISSTISSNQDSVLAHKFLPESQPTCPICLDDFESGTTPIRELPCGHIFHPDCIDSFLLNNSSLCPMCKKSVLPKGHCPTEITNSMVRRERNLQRLRSRVPANDEEGDTENPRSRIRYFSSQIKRRILHPSSMPIDPESDPVPLQPQPALMTTAITRPDPVLGAEGMPNGDRPSRQEIVQQRIQELTTGQSFIEDPDASNERRRPKCKSLSRSFSRHS